MGGPEKQFVVFFTMALRQDFTTFALSAIKTNYKIVNPFVTASTRDHVPILRIERQCASEADH